MRVFCGLILAFAIYSGVAVADRYEDAALGFSIEVPDGWQPFTQEEMDRMQQLLRDSGEQSVYVAGFKSAAGPVQMPYLLVQWLPNAMYGIRGQMTEEEIGKVSEVTKEKNAENANTSTASEFTVDIARKQTVYAYEVDLQGMRICCLGMMQFGRNAIFQSLYYARTMDELAEGSPARQMVMSLQLTPEAAWNEAAFAEASEADRMNRLIRGILLGVAIAGLVGLALSALTNKKK